MINVFTLNILLSVSGLFKVIFYIILFYYIFKVLARIFAPILLKYALKKAQDRFNNGQNYKQEPTNKEGEVTIDKMPPKNKVSNNDVGEYVDYEEIK